MSEKDINRLSKLYIALSIISVLVATAISARIWMAGRQIGNEELFGMSFIIAFLNLVGSLIISSVLYYTSWLIRIRKHFRVCKIVSIVLCFMFPIGTALGAYSLSILDKTKFAKMPGSEFKKTSTIKKI
jgi:membrane protein YdbS with pleckstrin-like domain